MSVLENEDDLEEVAGAVGCQVVVEDQVVSMIVLMRKLQVKILLSKMLWAWELLVEQHRWWVKVADEDEIGALEWTCFVEEVVDRPACWTLQ